MGASFNYRPSKRRVKEYVTEKLPNGKTRTVPVYESFGENFKRDLNEAAWGCLVLIVIIGVILGCLILGSQNKSQQSGTQTPSANSIKR